MKIKQFNSQIFYTKFTNQYKLGMFSLRPAAFSGGLQGYVGKKFDIFNYMESYAKRDGSNTFTFPSRWAGYCFPSEYLHEFVKKGIPKNKTKYDEDMLRAYEYCSKKSDKFCYIVYKDQLKFHHELAHAFYNLYSGYVLCSNINYDNLPEDHIKKINAQLKTYGYSKEEYRDETQAFLSSSPRDLGMPMDESVKEFSSYYKKTYREVLDL